MLDFYMNINKNFDSIAANFNHNIIMGNLNDSNFHFYFL